MFKKSKEFQCCFVYLSNAFINSKSNSDIHFLLKFENAKHIKKILKQNLKKIAIFKKKKYDKS